MADFWLKTTARLEILRRTRTKLAKLGFSEQEVEHRLGLDSISQLSPAIRMEVEHLLPLENPQDYLIALFICGQPVPRKTLSASLRPIKIMVVLLLLTVLFLGQMELKVTGEFSIFPNHNADVRAEVEGIIEKIYAEEGDVVHEGQLIARLSDLDFRAELQKVEAEIAEKRAKLRLLRAGPTSEELSLAQKEVDTARTKVQHGRNRYEESRDLQQRRLAKARAAVSKAEERLRYARSYFNTHEELFDQNLIARLELEKSREELDFRAKELEEAQADLRIVSADDFTEVKERLAVEEKGLEEAEGKVRLVRAGNRPEEIEAVEAEISRLEA